MITIEILEDCSPYYIKIRHTNQVKLLDLGNRYNNEGKFQFIFDTYPKFVSKRLLPLDQKQIFDLSILSKFYSFSESDFFVSIFSSYPGLYYRPHKDGNGIKFGINYILKSNNLDCVTNWYLDEIEKTHTINSFEGKSKEIIGFDSANHVPCKSTVFQENECILFNTDIYHDFDNRLSTDDRHVLILRPRADNISFFDIRNLIINKNNQLR